MHLTPITGDVFDITQRIKEIDEGYRLYYNHRHNRFEVYRDVGLTPTLVLTWNNRLDARLIEKLYRTRIENIKKIIEMIERNNEEIQNRAIERAIDKAGYETKQYIKYVSRHGNRELLWQQ